MSRLWGPVLAGALCAAIVTIGFTLLAQHAQDVLAVHAAPADSVYLQFTLPSKEALGCGVGMAPCTDLDSTLLYRQDRYQQPRVVQRARVRGMEGLPYHFAVPATLQAVYYVTVKDTTGNEACGSNLIQIAGAVSVPYFPPVFAETLAALYDLAGRRITGPTRPGIYFQRIGLSAARRIVVIK